MSGDRQFSEISFTRYDLAVERLTGVTGGSGLAGVDSIALIAGAIARGGIDAGTAQQLGARATYRRLAAIAAFPNGRRGNREFPLELTVLGIAFLERAITGYLDLPVFGLPTGSLFIVAAAVLVFAVRLARPLPRRAAEVAG